MSGAGYRSVLISMKDLYLCCTDSNNFGNEKKDHGRKIKKIPKIVKFSIILAAMKF